MKTPEEMLKTTVEVEYFCKECNVPFVVYHTNDDRNDICIWCRKEVVLTGVVNKFEDGDVVTYKDGVEIARRKQNKIPQNGLGG